MNLVKKTKWKHSYYCGNCGYDFWDDAPTKYNDEGKPFCPRCNFILDGGEEL